AIGEKYFSEFDGFEAFPSALLDHDDAGNPPCDRNWHDPHLRRGLQKRFDLPPPNGLLMRQNVVRDGRQGFGPITLILRMESECSNLVDRECPCPGTKG